MTGLALVVTAFASPLTAVGLPAERSYELPRSTVTEVGSYQVMIAWPEGEPPATGWPVIYVLDGEDNFAITALTARRLARASERSGVDAGVVVGIAAGPLARRVRDYTPATPGWAIPEGRPAHGLATGGAEAFLDLIEHRVMPLVHADRWRINRSRETLAGHSFGGVLALHAAFTRPALFDNVVAVSPSLWLGDGLLAREAAHAPVGPQILIAEGDDAMAGIGSPASFVATLGGRALLLSLPGQTHGTTMLAATPPAITFAFGKANR